MGRVGKVNEAYRFYFSVRQGSGAPRTGLVTVNFDIEIRNPDNDASQGTPVTIVEVGDGLYFFDILAAFTLAEGVGEYGITIEIILAPFDTVGDTVQFFISDIDDLALEATAALAETEAAAAVRETTNTAEHAASLAAIILNETEASAAARQTAVLARFTGIEGATFATGTDSLEAIRDRGDAAWITAVVGGIAAAVWEELGSAHLTAGTFGAIMARILGFAGQSNILLDGGPNAADPTVPDYDAAGLMLNGRLRVFDTAGNLNGATAGNVAVETGELFRQLIIATSVTTPGRADSYQSERAL